MRVSQHGSGWAGWLSRLGQFTDEPVGTLQGPSNAADALADGELPAASQEPALAVSRHRDPERSVLAWAWTRHGVYRERYMGVRSLVRSGRSPGSAHAKEALRVSRVDGGQIPL